VPYSGGRHIVAETTKKKTAQLCVVDDSILCVLANQKNIRIPPSPAGTQGIWAAATHYKLPTIFGIGTTSFWDFLPKLAVNFQWIFPTWLPAATLKLIFDFWIPWIFVCDPMDICVDEIPRILQSPAGHTNPHKKSRKSWEALMDMLLHFLFFL
jgi:hypothetical protein